MRYADCPVDEEAANHRALGSSCNHSPDAETMCSCAPAATFTILSQGAWQEHAEAHGHGDELRAMVETRTLTLTLTLTLALALTLALTLSRTRSSTASKCSRPRSCASPSSRCS